jgi:hypothetical protein
MEIISSVSRDRYLHQLYAQKELLCFLEGETEFYKRVDAIWNAYYDYVKMPDKWRKKIQIDVALWEMSNDYTEV